MGTSNSTRHSNSGANRKRTGSTTRDEPAGPVEARPDVDSVEAKRAEHTANLFPSAPGARLFGEGSYLTGGSPAEGNYAPPDPNPLGGYGSFDDAGGVGSTELLGGKTPDGQEAHDDRGAADATPSGPARR